MYYEIMSSNWLTLRDNTMIWLCYSILFISYFPLFNYVNVCSLLLKTTGNINYFSDIILLSNCMYFKTILYKS